MITYSIIQKSQLEGAHRMDAEYYQPEYLEICKKIKAYQEYFYLKDIMAEFGSGKNLPQIKYIENKTIPYIRTQNVRPVLIDNDGLSGIRKGIDMRYYKLNEGDLLAVRVGEGVGNSSVVTANYKDSGFSDNVIRFRVKALNPFYVSVFLNCKIGNKIWERISKGSARSLVSKENFDSILVPKISECLQIYCEDIIKKASNKIIESQFHYSQAEDLLLEELGLKDFESREDLFYVVNLSDIESVHRADAEYWQPKYEKLLSYLKKFELKKLRDLVSVKKGIEPGSEKYQKEGKPFIRVSNLSKFGINDNDQKYLADDFYQELRRNYQPKTGEILLSKDATPGIAYVVKESIEGIIAGGILRLKVETDLEPEYLTLLINSPIGQYQMERDIGGSVIVHWRPEQIRNIYIPIIEKPTQQKIASLVRRSHEARKKAKELLEEAKQKVEKTILGAMP